MKRMCDAIVAALMLVLASPVMLTVAILISITMGRPIFFRDSRTGLSGKVFTMYKFRTMSDTVDRSGNPLSDEMRLTKLGALLRASSLDELPELINVLSGNMSLVGPRPLLPQYLPLYSREQNRRHEVKPGITGWAQVNGRNSLTWQKKFELDVWYVDNQNFLLDIKILYMTLIAVFKREGISGDGQVGMSFFEGNPEGYED